MVQVHLGPLLDLRVGRVVYLHPMKKLLLLVVLAGVGYLVYRQVTANQNDDDLWSEVGADQDLR